MSTLTPAVADLSPDRLRALAEQAGRDLEGSHPADVLRWARDVFGTDLVLASSMGDEVLVDLAAKAAPGIDVVFLDTGYHFAETIGTRDYYADFTDVRLRTVLPLRTVAEQDAEHGPRLHERDPNLCCALRKVEPLERALAPYTAWVTGMRREDAPTRTDIAVVGWDAKRSKVKLNPLAAWTRDDVDAYVAEHHVVLNPLRELGYASIGCAPCTRAVAPGEDPRAGRWAGTNKTECGLHT
ncbi:phosphoadenylyl-sulfate reductase [Cellulomonas wangsupingiae]|uniref:Adenosine 5'-phosphosulfate reductase n=1 Tax=Cellulomonas wangsupingiae TaxID=2968085 RepID=A0ABY5KBK2_9CELL|nr:phosphoadenylyl-sulfate reductase [Cellulomonas wangsupingiae]MCC2333105.1 phosphoadenylyl-sulfate reductase [Cellulomonas wangsupingiae]MCM0640464.1 phosphoadenylyl-sulfate reductase [Cellulomonas wangsupingiae]UUI66821.1 phosphoadenylyl-sulfate reductase [Cellulomonas wangsupingiae]